MHGLTHSPLSRRTLLHRSTCGLGTVALASLCQEAGAAYRSPRAPKAPHFPPRAKRVIFLHMRGGPAHMDTFDRKPQLNAREGNSGRNDNRQLVGTPWKWRRRGESGLWVSDLLPNIAEHADDLCVLSGMHTEISNHTPATLFLHTGAFQFTRPSVGSWVLYGLGTPNQNLPGFISICPPVINGGTKNYGSAFLPAVYQGTSIGNINQPVKKANVENIGNPRLSKRKQRRQLDYIQSLNESYASQSPEDDRLNGVIQSYELAFSMQSEMPDLMDLSDEPESIKEMYGIGDGERSDNYGRQCLLARRFAEAGVRFIECSDEFWDQHNNLKKGHERRAAATDRPVAALLKDLKQRGMLEDTLVLWGGEFGRTPDTGRDHTDGRDHNANGYTMFMAGGGIRGGYKYGATDELGYEAVEGKFHTHDMHATLLHQLGLDHKELTYRYAGRDFRLTDVHGHVPSEIIA